jgi:hypothetical protein
MTFLRQFVIGMYLDGEVLAGVNELDEEREGITIFLINPFTDEQSFVLVNELGEIETEIHIADDTAFNGYGLVTGYGTDLPRLADIRLGSEDPFERCYLVPTPDGGTEVRCKLIRLHRN